MEQELSARMAGLEEKVTALSRRTERLEKGQTALNRLATAVVLAAYFNKSRAENTRGGIVYDSALGRNGDWDA